MNRGALHSKARRLINERTAGAFSDAEVNEALNFAYYEAQARVRLVARHEFLSRARANTVANQARYQRPTYENVHALRILDSVAGEYKDMALLPVEAITADWAATRTSNRERYGYALEGTELVIAPTPTTSVTDGLEVLFYDPLGMSDDTDVPRLPVALHHRLAYGAAVHLLADSKDVAAELWSDIARKWEEVFGENEQALRELKRHYRHHQPMAFAPGVSWAT